MLKFEEYLSDFTNSVNVLDFIINMILATLLSILVKWFYVKYGKSFSNREKFAIIFVPMALSTLLIITVVQASIALSLGLVGALSIVRFRAAIKEPEELTYIFLIIGIGLTCGANKPLLAIIAILIILPLIYFNTRFSENGISTKDKLLINIHSKSLDLNKITSVLSNYCQHVELRRFEENTNGLQTSFLAKCDDVNNISQISKALKESDKEVVFSCIDQPEMVL